MAAPRKLRASFFDVVQNKMPHLLKWRRFQKRKEFMLPSHRIQRFAETRDMTLGNRPDFINHDDLAPTVTLAKNMGTKIENWAPLN